ncbi:MAG: ribosomal RNA small subunit methyltransferase A [Clostridiales bacterium]|nr:ribosomal RNA small subunit methyltransferase A [Clostridiales bacterium]
MMDVKQLLREMGFRFNKQFGQNFLTDENLLNNICSDAEVDGGTVLEIGAGAGTLTRVLSKRADNVIAFEIDRNLEKVLNVTLADCNNVKVVMGDVMRYKMPELEALCGGNYRVVANIPYYLTSPLIMRFVEEASNVTSLTLTIQKEVAERLAAKPSTKDYGAITVAVNAVADVEITRVLPRDLFYPQPNVDSAVVRIDFKRDKFDILNAQLFRKTVKASFAMRRKTLVNNLAVGFGISKQQAEEILLACNLPVGCRGEELSVEQFVQLYNTIENLGLK